MPLIMEKTWRADAHCKRVTNSFVKSCNSTSSQMENILHHCYIFPGVVDKQRSQEQPRCNCPKRHRWPQDAVQEAKASLAAAWECESHVTQMQLILLLVVLWTDACWEQTVGSLHGDEREGCGIHGRRWAWSPGSTVEEVKEKEKERGEKMGKGAEDLISEGWKYLWKSH